MTQSNPGSSGWYRVSIVTDPPGSVLDVTNEKTDKAMAFLMRCLARTPWSCRFDISVPDGKLEMNWRRAGSTAGYAFWKWNDRAAGATAIFLGHDPDDCLAFERLAHHAASTGVSLPPAFLEGLRQNTRPLVGIAFAEADLKARKPIAEFSMGLSKGFCTQFKLTQSRPPLGAVVPQDFPPRFIHVLVVNGVITSRLWAESNVFRRSPNMQQAVTTFMDRFEDSFEKFDERILFRDDSDERRLLRTDSEDRSMHRIEWTGLRPTAGTAELTDDRRLQHTLLLLSGKEPDDDNAAIDHFAATLPHYVRGLFEAPLRELRTCPRPTLMDLVGTAPAMTSSATAPISAALGLAFFRWLGAF